MDPEDAPVRKPREIRNHTISVRFRSTEFDMLKQLSDADGLNMTGWIRKTILMIFKNRKRKGLMLGSQSDLLPSEPHATTNGAKEPLKL